MGAYRNDGQLAEDACLVASHEGLRQLLPAHHRSSSFVRLSDVLVEETSQRRLTEPDLCAGAQN